MIEIERAEQIYTLRQISVMLSQNRELERSIANGFNDNRMLKTGGNSDGFDSDLTSLVSQNDLDLKSYNCTESETDKKAEFTICSPKAKPPFLAKFLEKDSTAVNGENFKFVINHSCTRNKSDPFLVIFVHSAPVNFVKRKGIRDTWANISEVYNNVILTVFLLGKTRNVLVQNKIEKEAQEYGDIVQSSFIDSYRNMTYKHIMGLRWVSQHCKTTSFVVKTDDDVLLHPYKLVNVLTGKMNRHDHIIQNNAIYCYVAMNVSAIRDERSKYYVTKEEYPHLKYPTYCLGYAYITTPSVVKQLYQLSVQTPFFWIDDVFVTGILAEFLNITRTEPKLSRNPLDVPKINLYDQIFFYDKFEYLTNAEGWRKVWNWILRRRQIRPPNKRPNRVKNEDEIRRRARAMLEKLKMWKTTINLGL